MCDRDYLELEPLPDMTVSHTELSLTCAINTKHVKASVDSQNDLGLLMVAQSSNDTCWFIICLC